MGELSLEKILKTIDPRAFAAIRERHASSAVAKYLDIDRWMNVCLSRARRLGLLEQGPRRRILDIGCGAGYFLYICEHVGHDVFGIDTPTRPALFTEITRLLNVPVLATPVTAFTPLELSSEHSYDLITAHMVTFNRHSHPDLWGAKEWACLLADLEGRLTPGGKIYLELNREPDGTCYTPALHRLFEDHGAEIDGHRITISQRGAVREISAPAR